MNSSTTSENSVASLKQLADGEYFAACQYVHITCNKGIIEPTGQEPLTMIQRHQWQ